MSTAISNPKSATGKLFFISGLVAGREIFLGKYVSFRDEVRDLLPRNPPVGEASGHRVHERVPHPGAGAVADDEHGPRVGRPHDQGRHLAGALACREPDLTSRGPVNHRFSPRPGRCTS